MSKKRKSQSRRRHPTGRATHLKLVRSEMDKYVDQVIERDGRISQETRELIHRRVFDRPPDDAA